MSHNRFRINGLDELREAFRILPAQARQKAKPIVRDTVDSAQVAVVAAYPQGRTGRLKKGVSVVVDESTYGITALLHSKAKEAVVFEYGSQARHTEIGANRGSMPPRPTFTPIVERKRRELIEQLIDLVEDELALKLTVTR